MKEIAIVLALAGSVWALALGDEPGGIAGKVVDAKTGAPVAHATLYYYRSPYVENSTRLTRLATNQAGFFSDVTLEPGRYVVMARFPGRVEGCAVDDVVGGETTRLKIEMGHDHIMCSGPRVHPALVDQNATSDVYRI